MATEQDVEAAKEALWAEAEKLFKKSHPHVETTGSDHTCKIKRAIKDIKRSSHIHGRIPGILEKLQLFINIGNDAMIAAPETVSLVWMGFSFIGQAIIKDAGLRLFIESTAEEMFEAVGSCEIYAQRYLRGKVQDYSSDTISKVRSRIPQLLCVVLNFAHLVKKYTKEKNGIVRVIASNFTTMRTKMQETADEAKSKLRWLEKAATRDFEDSALDELRRISCKLDTIDSKITAQDIRRTFNENFQALKKGIASMEAPQDRHQSHLSERWEDTCSWILQEENFKSWSKERSGLLWLHGPSGFGKSFIMSTVIEDQLLNLGPDTLMLFFFCKRGKNTETGFHIMMHLCVQLLVKAKYKKVDNVRLQQECNSIIGEKQAWLAKLSKSFSHMEVPQIKLLFNDLARKFQEQIIIAVDGLDECVDLETSKLIPTLKSLANSKHFSARVIISSCPADSPSLHRVRPLLEGVSCIEVSREKTENDISKYVGGSIKKEFVHWEKKTMRMATKEIISSSGGQFKLIQDASDVMKRLMEPNARDLPFEELAPTFPKTSSGFYRQKFAEMENGDRKFLIIALRWLICGQETMDLQPIADELFHRFDKDTGKLPDSPIRERAAQRLEKIGRGFLKVTSTSIQLDHGPIRDFVNSEDNIQDELGKLILQASTHEGSFLLAETILRRLNSPAFQKAYLTSEARSAEPLRYELENWVRHLADVEGTWDVETCDDEHRKRLEALLDAADNFLKAGKEAYYRSWLKQTSSSEEESSKDKRLHTACRYGLSGLMKRFLGRGHPVNDSNSHQNTPLHLVCLGQGNFRGLDLLFDKNRKVNLDPQNKDKATPLLLAVKSVRADLKPIEFLLAKGADPRIPDDSGSTCLHFAAAAHNKALCEILLRHETLKVNVNAEDDAGETPLHWACKERNAPKDLIELLLNNQANLNAQDANSQAPLYKACRVGNVEVARFLLEKGADINDDDVSGETALHATVYGENTETAGLLIRYNAPKTKLNDEKASKAGKNKPSDCFGPLDLFKRNSKGQDALNFAAASNKGLMVSYLITVYRDRQLGMKSLLTSDKSGFIPLHYCIQRNNESVARSLLEAGDGRRMCTVATNKGNQALHLAAARGHPALAKLLLQYSAPTSTGLFETSYGPTPLDAAFAAWHASRILNPETRSRFEDTIETIFNARAIKDVVPGHRRKLHLAIFRGSKRVCKLFQDTWAQQDEHGWTAHMLAAAYKFDLSQIRDQKRLPGAPSTTHGNQARPATKSPSMWASTARRTKVKRSDDGLKVTFAPDGDSTSIRRAVRTDHPVPYNTKKFYFEIKIEEGEVKKSSIAVGFCSALAYLSEMPGSQAARALTWSYHGEKGEKYARSVKGQSYSKPFGKGDVIGCRLDFAQDGKGTISFTKNEKELGPAFEKTVKGQLFPVVGFSGSVETTVSLRFPDSEEKKAKKGNQKTH